MIERVGVKGVARAGEGGDHAGIGEVATPEEERGIRLLEARDVAFQHFVRGVVAADQPGCRRSGRVVTERGDRSGGDAWLARQPQVVVG